MIELISRGMLLALVLAASGCTFVVNEGAGPGTPPPPPPPPRARVAHQPARAQAHRQPAPAVERPASGSPTGSPTGRLAITVRGGSCQVRVDTRSHGIIERLRLEVPVGSRVVTCQAPGGTLQAHTAVVHRGQVTGVEFDITAAPRKVPRPPGGRPRL